MIKHPRRTRFLCGCGALAAVLCCGIVLSPQARANDGGIAWGGSPSLLRSHPSISMRSEVVRITVGEENVLVDCRFVFQNTGAATSVRMGFPDEGEGDASADETGEEWRKGRPTSNFRWFKSWVDGAPVKTELVKGSETGVAWHAKTVAFAARSQRVVRDQYSVPVGSQIGRSGVYRQAAYTLRTGSSWKGPIGRSEVTVLFSQPLGSPKLGAHRLRAVVIPPGPDADDGYGDSKFEDAMKPGVVVVRSGPGLPAASGHTLRWVRTNWRPSSKDDIHIAFGFKAIPQPNQGAGG